MAYMGAGGMRATATISARRAHHLAAQLMAVPGLALAYPRTPFLWEFVLRTPSDAGAFASALRKRGIVAGLPLGRFGSARDDQLLVCCTELTSPDAIERYVAAAGELAVTAPREPLVLHA
jgi:glycine cleavage system pyridoxal-binding protein P